MKYDKNMITKKMLPVLLIVFLMANNFCIDASEKKNEFNYKNYVPSKRKMVLGGGLFFLSFVLMRYGYPFYKKGKEIKKIVTEMEKGFSGDKEAYKQLTLQSLEQYSNLISNLDEEKKRECIAKKEEIITLLETQDWDEKKLHDLLREFTEIVLGEQMVKNIESSFLSFFDSMNKGDKKNDDNENIAKNIMGLFDDNQLESLDELTQEINEPRKDIKLLEAKGAMRVDFIVLMGAVTKNNGQFDSNIKQSFIQFIEKHSNIQLSTSEKRIELKTKGEDIVKHVNSSEKYTDELDTDLTSFYNIIDRDGNSKIDKFNAFNTAMTLQKMKIDLDKLD